MSIKPISPQIANIEEIVQTYLDGKLVFIPEHLLSLLDCSLRRREFRETAMLVWTLIGSRCYGKKKQKWTQINHEDFLSIANHRTVDDAKDWLIAHNFIEWDIPYVGKNIATAANPAKYQSYKCTYRGKNTAHVLRNKEVNRCLTRNEPKHNQRIDAAAVYTREQLDGLEIDEKFALRIFRYILTCLVHGVDYRSKNPTFPKTPIADWQDDYLQWFGIPLLSLKFKAGRVEAPQVWWTVGKHPS